MVHYTVLSLGSLHSQSIHYAVLSLGSLHSVVTWFTTQSLGSLHSQLEHAVLQSSDLRVKALVSRARAWHTELGRVPGNIAGKNKEERRFC